MSAIGLTTDAIRNAVAAAYTTACVYVGLLKALTLQAGAAAGAATFSVDLSVQAGDVLVLDFGLAAQEQVTVQSVTGSGPYTVTPTSPLAKAHSSGARISHIPISSTTVHEISVSRVAAAWGSPSPAGTVTSTPSFTVSAGAGNVVGSVALFSASTAGTYYDAGASPVQDFSTTGGGYAAVWVESFT